MFGPSDRYKSDGLVDFVYRYATRLSYALGSELAHERCGGVSMSDQHIQKLVVEKSQLIARQQAQFIAQEATKALPDLMKISLYETVIWIEDGVCVNQQKAQRNKIAKLGKQRTITERVLLSTPVERIYRWSRLRVLT